VAPWATDAARLLTPTASALTLCRMKSRWFCDHRPTTTKSIRTIWPPVRSPCSNANPENLQDARVMKAAAAWPVPERSTKQPSATGRKLRAWFQGGLYGVTVMIWAIAFPISVQRPGSVWNQHQPATVLTRCQRIVTQAKPRNNGNIPLSSALWKSNVVPSGADRIYNP